METLAKHKGFFLAGDSALVAGKSKEDVPIMRTKKIFMTALATAILAGATSTSFASVAANPFSDVPRDHWAYDSVRELADEGVIEGYGDDTFRGDREITRYEMAQMVAKAMAKENLLNDMQKMKLNRLSAEFGEELKSLGVRVADLESKTDNVKWTGSVAFTARSERHDDLSQFHNAVVNNDTKNNSYQLRLRLDPTAKVNDNWKMNARISGYFDVAHDKAVENDNSKLTLDRLYAKGEYNAFGMELGKVPMSDKTGILFDEDVHNFSGGKVSVGKDAKLTVGAGRWSSDNEFGYARANNGGKNIFSDKAADYQFAEAQVTQGKWDAGVAYHHFSSDALKGINKNSKNDNADIVSINAKYAFDKNIALKGAYAKNNDAEKYNEASTVEMQYKGAERENQGSWGVYAAYRYLGANAAFAPLPSLASYEGQRGWEVGGQYTFFKNTIGSLRYFNGVDMKADADKKNASTIFGRLEFMF